LQNDPHESVSHSKISFFYKALNFLSTKIKRKERTILDIGCGYGYFIDLARQKGWEPAGVEVLEDAVKSSKEKIRSDNIFHGKLDQISLSAHSFDAITLWDVLAIVDKPYKELKESHRLLKRGGIVGIRTRYVKFQMSAYRIFTLIRRIALRFGLKEPYEFNKYCFSDKSLHALLSRLGYINIKIFNSPLTSGDPYKHLPFNYPVKIIKICIDICSQLAFIITGGRWLTAPSLLVWAEKP
jgi:2-polyprenyl-3-methyl-5-hydroxy-6-metoxy-1,4-benzoquinol methylase